MMLKCIPIIGLAAVLALGQPITPDHSWRLGVPAQSQVELSTAEEHLWYRISTPEQVRIEKHNLSGVPIEQRVLPGKSGQYLPLFEIGRNGPAMIRFDGGGLVTGTGVAVKPPAKGFGPILVGDQIAYYNGFVPCAEEGGSIPQVAELRLVAPSGWRVRLEVAGALYRFASMGRNQVVAARTNLETERVEIHVIAPIAHKVQIIPVSEEWLNEALRRKLAESENEYERAATHGLWNLATHDGKIYFTAGQEPLGQAHAYELDPGTGTLTPYLLELPEPTGWHPEDFGVTDDYLFVLGREGRMLRFRK